MRRLLCPLLAALAVTTGFAQNSAVPFPRDQIALQLGAIQMGYATNGAPFTPADQQKAANALAQGRIALSTTTGWGSANVVGAIQPADYSAQLDAAVQAVMTAPANIIVKGKVTLSNLKEQSITGKLAPPSPAWSVPTPNAISSMTAGPQGPAGPAGPKGDTGATGVVGSAGPKGDAGTTGAAGPVGAQGPKGDTGATGAVGSAGPAGPKGDTGTTGAAGPAGAVGQQGPKGDTGAAGLQGSAGPKGDKGDPGEQGPQGIAGPTGPQGDVGPKGDTGESGSAGLKGDAGPQGPIGITGANGDKGDQGETGRQGDIGLKGDKGDLGDRGPQGLVGPAGEQGLRGDTGAQGPAGPKGDKGDVGPPVDISSLDRRYGQLERLRLLEASFAALALDEFAYISGPRPSTQGQFWESFGTSGGVNGRVSTSTPGSYFDRRFTAVTIEGNQSSASTNTSQLSPTMVSLPLSNLLVAYAKADFRWLVTPGSQSARITFRYADSTSAAIDFSNAVTAATTTLTATNPQRNKTVNRVDFGATFSGTSGGVSMSIANIAAAANGDVFARLNMVGAFTNTPAKFAITSRSKREAGDNVLYEVSDGSTVMSNVLEGIVYNWTGASAPTALTVSLVPSASSASAGATSVSTVLFIPYSD